MCHKKSSSRLCEGIHTFQAHTHITSVRVHALTDRGAVKQHVQAEVSMV